MTAPPRDIHLELGQLYEGSLTELVARVRSALIALEAVELGKVTSSLKSQAPDLPNIGDAGEAINLSAWLVRERTRRWLEEVLGTRAPNENAEDLTDEKVAREEELALERAIIAGLVAMARETDTEVFRRAAGSEPDGAAPEEVKDDGEGEPLAAAAQKLLAAAKVLAPIEWYTEAELRREILKRLEEGPLLLRDAFGAGEPRKLVAAFGTILELIRFFDGQKSGAPGTKVIARQQGDDLWVGTHAHEPPEHVPPPVRRLACGETGEMRRRVRASEVGLDEEMRSILRRIGAVEAQIEDVRRRYREIQQGSSIP